MTSDLAEGAQTPLIATEPRIQPPISRHPELLPAINVNGSGSRDFDNVLVERGAVIRQGQGRKRLYSAAEPAYSMYYKLRRERDEAAVVENLIRFMVACCGVGDLWSFSGPLSAEAAESEAIRRGIGRALSCRPPEGDVSAGLKSKWKVIQQISDQAWAHAESSATKNLQDAVGVAFEDSGTAWTTYLQANAYEQLGNARNVLAISDRVVRLVDSRYPEVLAWTALTLVMRARARTDLGDFRAAIATCDATIQPVVGPGGRRRDRLPHRGAGPRTRALHGIRRVRIPRSAMPTPYSVEVCITCRVISFSDTR